MTAQLPSLLKLRRLAPEEIIRKYSGATQKIFAAMRVKATPVIIPSRDEERDLPSCLVALARSADPVQPVIVVNNSHDRTYERAQVMGATVVEINGVKKMGATQKGLATVLQNVKWPNPKRRIILFTDADTLVRRYWARTLTRHLTMALDVHPDAGAATFGSSIFWHGPSFMADLAQTVHGFYADIRQWALVRPPLIRGHNYGIGLDSGHKMIDILYGLDPMQMYRDDVTIHDSLKASGVKIVRCLHPGATVLTRGDRAHSLKQFLKNLYTPGYEKSLYDEQYALRNHNKKSSK